MLVAPSVDHQSVETPALRQLVYLSRATRAFSSDELIELSESAATNNRSFDIGGALLFGMGMFMQVLEGEHDAVETVSQKIFVDPRHTEVGVVIDHQVPRRQFRNWAMTLVALDIAQNWTQEHQQMLGGMTSIASFVPKDSGAHVLMGMFAKRVGTIRQMV